MHICFLTTNDFGFGGSEDLWIATALKLLERGFTVAASVRQWQPLPVALRKLQNAGCTILWHDTPGSAEDFAELIEFAPDIVVVSQGYQLEGLDWLERIVDAELPFVLINQCVHEAGWVTMDESTIARMVRLHSAARTFMFVSEGNRRLYEKMTGIPLANATIVRNPFKVPYDVELPWPEDRTLSIATVGRIECFHKGYDLLFEVLRSNKWHTRSIRLNIYGDGPHRQLLMRLAQQSGFRPVQFHGYVSDITEIWKQNHVLVQPSRLEGLPLSIIEAQLCARVVVATDVAGHSEVIRNGATGFLAEAPTARHLDAALECMWQSRDHLRQIGSESRKSIQHLVPRDPAAVLAENLVELSRTACAKPRPVRELTPLARVVPRVPRHPTDHHAHLYFAIDGVFSENKKIATDYPAGKWVQLRFSGLQGLVRFDPGARAGVYRIRKLSISGSSGSPQVVVLTGHDLKGALCAFGTVNEHTFDESGLTVYCNGEDPSVLVSADTTQPFRTFALEFEICGE